MRGDGRSRPRRRHDLPDLRGTSRGLLDAAARSAFEIYLTASVDLLLVDGDPPDITACATSG
jgi:hypothetical protein